MATLPIVLDRLAQDAAAGAEVIVVESSADGSDEIIRHRWPWVRVLALPERTIPGRARNLGAAAAAGEVLVFLDADAVPAPGWLAALLLVLEASRVGVAAGAVDNGTPGSAVGTAGWLLEFSEWLPGRRGPMSHGASCNLAVTRKALDRAGGFPEQLFPGEDTILTVRIVDGGHLPFAGGAVVHHHNRTSFRAYLKHQYRLGVSFAEVCRTVPIAHSQFGRPLLAPFGGLLRLLALMRRLAGRSRDTATAIALSPLLAVGLIAWTAGVVSAARSHR